MWSFAWSQVRRDVWRSLVVLGSLVFAVTSFVTLTSASETQRLTTTATVQDNFRVGFDILVRPASSVSAFEKDNALVRGGFLGGVYGGMPQAKLDAIRGLAGVEVAAPIAVVGTVSSSPAPAVIDVTDSLPPGDGPHLLVLQYTTSARDGRVAVRSGRVFAYFTKGDVVIGPDQHAKGEVVDGAWHNTCPLGTTLTEKEFTQGATSEVLANRGHAVCQFGTERIGQPLPAGFEPQPGRQYVVAQAPGAPFLVAAVDPDAEAQLAGLDKAITAGRWFTPTDNREATSLTVPAVVAGTAPAVDYQTTVSVAALPSEAVAAWRSNTTLKFTPALRAIEPWLAQTAPTQTQVFDAARLYGDVLANNPPVDGPGQPKPGGGDIGGSQLVRADNPTPSLQADGTLSYPAVPAPVKDFRLEGTYTFLDGGTRQITVAEASGMRFYPVGIFDPAKVDRGSYSVGEAPFGLYEPNRLLAADAETARLNGGDEFRTMLNPMDYQQLTPSVLIPWNTLGAFDKAYRGFSDAPISAIRVRVAGVTGVDDLSNERLRSVADQIQALGGVQVDIAAGSSTTDQTIHLSATKNLPATSYVEQWTKKGVAVVVQQAIDAKSLLLAALVLAASVLTVVISATAAVAARRRELGVLAAIGWRQSSIRRSVLAEQAILGGAAGLVGALLAWPVSLAAGLTYQWRAALLAVPVTLLLCLAAGLYAWASRARVAPIVALRPIAAQPRKVLLPGGGATTIGLTSILRHPSRLALAALAVALPAASITVLDTITTVFKGRITGTVLGEAVTLQVRTPDRIAAACLIVLGITCVVTVLLVGLTEDAATLATLASTGWNDLRLAWLLTVQALLIGALGAGLGLAATLALINSLGIDLTPAVVALAGRNAAAAAIITMAVALAPASMLRRLPLARLLSRD